MVRLVGRRGLEPRTYGLAAPITLEASAAGQPADRYYRSLRLAGAAAVLSRCTAGAPDHGAGSSSGLRGHRGTGVGVPPPRKIHAVNKSSASQCPWPYAIPNGVAPSFA